MESTNEINEFTENIFNTVREPLLVLDKDLRVLKANSSFYSFFRVSPDQTIGTYIYELGNRQWDIPKLKELLEKILPEKTTFDDYEVEHDFKDIGDRILLLNARQIERAPGKEKIILLAFEDITGRRSSEKKLRVGEEEFREIIEHSADSIFIVDNQGRYVYINTEAVQMLGYSKEEMLQLTIADLAPKNRVGEYLEIFQQTVQEGSFFAEIQLVKKDGNLLSADLNTALMPNGLIYGSCRDITERKQIESALKTNEERFRTAAESLSDVIYSWDIKQKLDWYGDIDGIMGYTPGGYPRTIEGWAMTIHPDDKDRIMEALEDHLKVKTPYSVEYRVRKKDGEWRWWSARGSALRDEQGKPYKMIGSITDISERKKAEESLSESYQIIEGIINSIPVRVFWKDRDLNYLGCNKLFAQDAGFTNPKEIIGKDDYQMGWSEQAELYGDDDRKIIESGESKLNIEEPQTTPEGNDISLLTSKIPLRNSVGEIIGVLGTYIDITERKHAEEEIQKSNEQFKMVWNGSIDGMRIMDENGTIILVNDAFCNMVGLTRNQLEGHHFSVLFHKSMDETSDLNEKNPKTEIYKLRFLENKIEPKFERELYLWDGRKVWFEVTNAYMEIAGGKSVLLSIFRDITERKQAELIIQQQNNRLKELNASKDKFFSIIAHDLKSPFNGFLSLTALMADTTEKISLDEFAEYSKMLNKAARNI
ncbi:MAG: PAS domain S-box protein, partial [Ignavibacteriota bacterium]